MQETFEIDVEADKIKELTIDELLSEELFSKIMSINDSAERKFYESKCSVQAKRLHITKEFNACLSAFKYKIAAARNISKGNKTNFIDQPLQLNCGEWICDVSGVRKNQLTANGNYEAKFASPIPVLVTEILKNIDDDTEKIKLAFFKEGWHTIICNRSTAASNTKIVDLSDKGIEVNSNNAKLLVKYIADLVALNLDTLPKYDAVSRMGWINDDFIPYNTNIKFDGELKYKPIFEAIHGRGDFSKWIDYTHNLRSNLLLRLQISTSFGSPLIKICNALPFILHFWGGTGNGKTVGLMVAMSVWGDPHKGKMWRSLDNTENKAAELSAFLNNIPVGLDELQTIKKFNCTYDSLVMKLTEGIDRGRMSYDKIERTKTWDCSYIFTGEEPLTRESSGGGTKNRVIEIQCEEKVIENGSEVVEFIYKNYGFAGEYFIECIKDENIREQYKEIHDEILNTCDTTEKQAMAMAVILLGDRLAVKYIYKNETPLTVNDVKKYLMSKKEVDTSERAYDWVLNMIAVNNNKFQNSDISECWGKIDEEYIFINKNVLVEQMRAHNFEFDAVKSEWAEKGYLIKNSQNKMFHNTHCNGVKGTYIKLRHRPDETVQISKDVPF